MSHSNTKEGEFLFYARSRFPFSPFPVFPLSWVGTFSRSLCPPCPCNARLVTFFVFFLYRQGRVPRPRELEITVLAYAPHFLGLAAAAANEALAHRSNGNISGATDRVTTADGASGRGNRSSEPSGGGGGGGGSGGGSEAALEGGGGGKGEGRGEGTAWAGCVPVGLSERSVWPDEEAGRKEADVRSYGSDPVKVKEGQFCLEMFGLFRAIVLVSK